MKNFELSTKQSKDGRRKFKVILYRIYPDSCVDETNQVGTMYNANGLTFLREYCEKALDSIKGMSLRCEFADEDRTELMGHGNTGMADGMPVFEDAVVLGTFTNGYIDEVDAEDGRIIACIGEGELDSQCYHNFVEKLEADIAQDIYPSGSVEIMTAPGNDSIKYLYGYKERGRIPTEFVHSGYALLGVEPADRNAKLIELNDKGKEDEDKMNENDIKEIVEKTVKEVSNHTGELNAIKSECEAKIEAANKERDAAIAEKNEIAASSEKIQSALDDAREELKKVKNELEAREDEIKTLEKSLGEAKAKERLGELNEAIAKFSEEEQAYARAEIEAFNADPVGSEINMVVNKIYQGIGEKAKEAAAEAEKRVAEQNEKHEEIDIFGEISTPSNAHEDVNIF